MKNVELLSFPGPDDLAVAVANAWVDEVDAANRAGKNYSVALSGGRITQKFFVATAEKALARNVSFSRVHFFWADERCVPPDDPESNYKLADDLLFTPLKVADGQIHRLAGELPPEEAVTQANEEFARIIPNGILDLIFLGMGEDGHVASLFQNARFGVEKDAKCNGPFIFVSDSPKPPPRRISLNFKAIITARQVWVLASGKGKEDAFKESLNGAVQRPLGQVIKNRAGTRVFSDIRI